MKIIDFPPHSYYSLSVKTKKKHIIDVNFHRHYLNTIGVGTQNLIRVFLMFSCKADSSKHHVVCSLAEGPAVGSENK